jgi:WD40 repeat protein/Flp pilus assembly protein TadD/limonene-1,2-epoxide hydrolase
MPYSNLTFRVFVSSTFTDMREERRILQKSVFPRLKALCESRGATFQDVDLRWGVNEEAQLDHKTMDICLGEIARCQRLSPKPNFLILLGDKYGWQPVPARIPSSEIQPIQAQLVDQDRALVTRWYREDTNAIPAEYVLQPREGDYLPYEAWRPEETRLRNALRKAVVRLPFTETQKIKYFASATHQEIVSGALNPPPAKIDAKDHVFAYLRNIDGMPEDSRAKDYIDLSDGKRDAYSKEQLEKLNEDLKGNGNKKGKLPAKHIFEYSAAWDNGCVLDDAKAFEERVYDDLKTIIESQLQEIEDLDSLTKEIKQHERFRNQRLEHFTGREEALAAIDDYQSSQTNKVFSIIGASGTGKTSLLAKAIDKAKDEKAVVVYRFIGTTSASSNSFRLLSEVIREIAQQYGAETSAFLKEGEDEKKLTTLQGLREILPRCLNLATKEKPLRIFLDALDQLSIDYESLSLDWIPGALPEHVKITVSALLELKKKLSQTAQYDLGAMSQADGESLLNKWLASMSRTLQPYQKEAVLRGFALEGTPLYLRLAFEKAKGWHSYSGDTGIKADISGMLDEYFDGLEKDHGSLLVRKVCGYLLSGKYQGLMEQEILDLLAFDQEQWQDFVDHCHPDHREEIQQMGKLPIVVWSRLFLDLERYLTEREFEGLSIVSFYHRKFTDHVRKRYIAPSSLHFHSVMADYFEKEPLYSDEKEEVVNVRKVVEQPYQQALANQWQDLANESLASFPFLMAKTKANMIDGILDDYAFLWDRAPEGLKANLNLWRAFFREKTHILRRGTPEWPAYKILLQLAVEHADDSPLTMSAEKWLEMGNCDWLWLRHMKRPSRLGTNPCLAVFEGHSDVIMGGLELENGGFISLSKDKTLRHWSHDGKPMQVFVGHNRPVTGALITTDGRILSWSDDATLRLWSAEGVPLVNLRGHAWGIRGALETIDRRYLSWSRDKTLRLWSSHGEQLASMEGHAGQVEGALETSGGRFLSWSEDKTIRQWSHDGRLLQVFEGHTGPVRGALVTTASRILSWSQDNTLRLWSEEGEPLAVLEGHAKQVEGALELYNGQFLSWSKDGSLRIWSSEGEALEVLKGHGSFVTGALDIRDGRILSWAVMNGPDFSYEKEDAPGLHIWHENEFVQGWFDHEELLLWLGDVKRFHLSKNQMKGLGFIRTKSGCYLSWSGSWSGRNTDTTLEIWSQSIQSVAVLQGHTKLVRGAIETVDGRFLSWSDDRTLRLWSHDGRPLAVLAGHTECVGGAYETRDGRFLSWTGFSDSRRKADILEEDYTLRLWSSSGESLAVLRGHSGRVMGVIETRDGRFLSWTGFSDSRRKADILEEDYTLRLWSSSGESLAVLRGHSGRVMGVIETRDGRFLSWSDDRTLRFWSHDGRPLAVLAGHTKCVGGAYETRDGRFLSWSDVFRLWTSTGEPLAVIGGYSGNKRVIEKKNGQFISWSENAIELFSEDKRCWYKLGGNRPFVILTGHSRPVSGALRTRKGQFVSWASKVHEYPIAHEGDRTIRLWSEQGKPLAVFEGHAGSVEGVIETREGHFLSWSDDNTLRLWSAALKPFEDLEGHKDQVTKVIETKDGRFLSCSFEHDNTMRLWSSLGDTTAILEGHTDLVLDVFETRDGRFLSRSYDKTLILWSRDGERLKVLAGHRDPVAGAFETRDGRFLSWPTASGVHVRLWSGEGEPLMGFKPHAGSVEGVIETGDAHFLSWSNDNTLRLWRSDGKSIATLKGHERSVMGALETRDGRRFLSWSFDNTLRLWSRAGASLATLKGHESLVKGALETRDGRFLSWSIDNTLRIWSRAGELLAVLEGQQEVVEGVLETPDGEFLSWSKDRPIRLWSATGIPIRDYTIEDAIIAHPEILPGYLGEEKLFGRAFLNEDGYSGYLRHINRDRIDSICWHGDSHCSARILKPDGRAVFSMENGKVCFLRLYHGNKQISIKELEAMYVVDNPEIVEGNDYRTRGIADFNTGKYDAAIEYLNQAILNKPQDDYAIRFLGMAYAAKGQYQEASREYDRSIALNPQSVYTYVDRGLSFHNLGEYDKAIEDYTKALELYPGYSIAYNNRGVSYERKGDIDQAIRDYTRATELDSKYFTAHSNLGKAFFNKSNYHKAIQCLNQAIALNPSDASIITYRGIGFHNLGEYEKAIEDYTKVIDLYPAYVIAHFNRGLSYERKGDIDQAIRDYTRAAELDPKYFTAYSSLGKALFNKGNYNEAIECLNKAIALNPQNAYIYVDRGLAFHNLGECDKAIGDYTKALELCPRYSLAYNNRGISYEKKGSIGEAIRDLSLAVETDPRNALAYRNRGRILLDNGNFDGAIADFDQVIQLNPEDSFATMLRQTALKRR